jgi:sugar phosphate isomerase/epimerase
MDFHFQTSMGVYSLDAQCEMLAELGYAGLCVSAWSPELDKLAQVKPRHGIEVNGVYVIFQSGGNDAQMHRLVESIEGCSTIELALRSGEGIQDGDLHMLEALLPVCERRGINIALYPHVKYGMQTTTEALSLCRRFSHPRLGIAFNGYHWYAMREGHLARRLTDAAPFLKLVNIAGCRFSPLGWGSVATIEPLDEGEMDNFVLLGQLQRTGYAGPIGFLGWSEGMGGDVYGNLDRSVTAFRSMEQRLVDHPSWALITNAP